jgi:hypothetical protein
VRLGYNGLNQLASAQPGDAGDQHTEFDRFGRVADQR